VAQTKACMIKWFSLLSVNFISSELFAFAYSGYAWAEMVKRA